MNPCYLYLPKVRAVVGISCCRVSESIGLDGANVNACAYTLLLLFYGDAPVIFQQEMLLFDERTERQWYDGMIVINTDNDQIVHINLLQN
jgi:hypothetical protein